jgi:hypothetical protein
MAMLLTFVKNLLNYWSKLENVHCKIQQLILRILNSDLTPYPYAGDGYMYVLNIIGS